MAQTEVKRSYKDEVLSKLEPLKETFDVEQYGALSVDKERCVCGRNRDLLSLALQQ